MLWRKCEGSVFLASNDLSSVPDASQFQACVCVSHGDWPCIHTSRELAQKETFEQRSSVGIGSISLIAIRKNVGSLIMMFFSELYVPFGGG